MAIMDVDSDALDRYSAMIRKRFLDIPTIWELKEEKFARISLLQFLYAMPLNWYQPMKKLLKHRFDILFKSNNAYIAPLVSDFKGYGNPHNLYVGRTGQVFHIDPFNSQGDYNMVIIGPPGSGKSFFCNDYLRNGLSAGWREWIFDLGDSYLNLNQELGGESIKFKEPKSGESGICLNFFTHINTKK